MRRFANFRTPTQARLAEQARRDYDARRRAETGTRALYGTERWKRLRAAHLATHPLCVSCEAAGVVTAATVCDHVAPHRGDVAAFWSGPFQSLCATCHSGAKAREERRGAHRWTAPT